MPVSIPTAGRPPLFLTGPPSRALVPSGVAAPVVNSFMLQEDGFFVLQEDGFKVILDG